MSIDFIYVSRLTEDIPSKDRPKYIHRAGTEIAPVKRLSEDRWLIEIRTREDGGFWYEQLDICINQSELVEVPVDSYENEF